MTHQDNAIELIVQSIPYVKAVLRNLVPSQDIDDLAQDVSYRMMSKIEQIQSYEAINGWAAQIAHNVANDYWRKKYRAADGEPLPMFAEHIFDDTPTPENAAIEAEERHVQTITLQEAINALPSYERQALVSFYYDGMTVRQIAFKMEKPVGTIKRWLHMARRTLHGKVKLN